MNLLHPPSCRRIKHNLEAFAFFFLRAAGFRLETSGFGDGLGGAVGTTFSARKQGIFSCDCADLWLSDPDLFSTGRRSALYAAAFKHIEFEVCTGLSPNTEFSPLLAQKRGKGRERASVRA